MFMIMVIARGSFLSFRKKEVVIWLNRKVKMGKMGIYDWSFFQKWHKNDDFVQFVVPFLCSTNLKLYICTI